MKPRLTHMMTTHFITATINLQESPSKLHQAIEAKLKECGEPLRWAITQVDVERQTAQIEAVIITLQSDV
jgi:hypothetical protein